MKKAWIAGVFLVVLIAVGGYFGMRKVEPAAPASSYNANAETNELERTWLNYAERIRPHAEQYDLPLSYLLALTSLECSGFYPPKSRYEKGVMRRLQSVKSGAKRSYEQVKKKHLAELNEAGLKNLATSWGPFQIMGYKCVAMDLELHEIRDGNAIKYGVQWIDEEYGKMLRKGRFSDSFHIHNTGRKLPRDKKPRTHDPRYIERGLSYMKFFEKKIQEAGWAK